MSAHWQVFIPPGSLPNSPFDFMCSRLKLRNLLWSPFSSLPWAPITEFPNWPDNLIWLVILPCLPALCFHSWCFIGPHGLGHKGKDQEGATSLRTVVSVWVVGGTESGPSRKQVHAGLEFSVPQGWATVSPPLQGHQSAQLQGCRCVPNLCGLVWCNRPRGKGPSVDGSPGGRRSLPGSCCVMVGPSGTRLYFLIGLLALWVSLGCPKEKDLSWTVMGTGLKKLNNCNHPYLILFPVPFWTWDLDEECWEELSSYQMWGATGVPLSQKAGQGPCPSYILCLAGFGFCKGRWNLIQAVMDSCWLKGRFID